MTKLLKEVNRWLSKLEHERRTRRELDALSDKDLNDIGISRCDIDRIARDYFAKKAF
jgi:uncharacterized protein YjiS (DUF1127 family)